MSELIDISYFNGTGLFTVSNVDANIVTQEGNYSRLIACIKSYERELMYKLIGKTLYDALIVGLAVTPTPETRWTALANQLRNATELLSPIANYIYTRQWQREQRQHTESGDVVLSGTGLINDANIPEICQIWNQMVDWLIEFQNWFFQNESTYTEWDGTAYIWTKNDYINILCL